MPNEQISITLPFREYIDDDFLGHLDNRPANHLKAKRIEAINAASKLQLVHVQYVSLETGKQLESPVVWRYDKWINYFKRIERTKEQSKFENAANSKQKENIELVKRHFMRKYKLDEQTAHLSAIQIARDGLEEFMREVMGIKQIKELSEEERQFTKKISYIDYEKEKRKI